MKRRTAFALLASLAVAPLTAQIPQETNTQYTTAGCKQAGSVPYAALSGSFWQPICAAPGTATQLLHGGAAPAFAAVDLAADTTGTLPVGSGGSGAASLTGLLIGNGVAAFTATTTSAGVAGEISDETGTGVMVFGTSPVFTTGITTPAVLSAGALALTPAAGSNVNVTTSTTGNFVVNTTEFVVDTGVGVGIGTSLPGEALEVAASTGANRALVSTGDASAVSYDMENLSHTWRLQNGGGGAFRLVDVTQGTNFIHIDGGVSPMMGILDTTPSFTVDITGDLNFTGDVTEGGSNTLSNDISGTAALANALTADPAPCSGGRRVSDMDADGTLTCLGFDDFFPDASPSSTAALFGYYDSGISARHEKLTFGALADALEGEIGLTGGSDEQILTRETTGGPLAYEDLCDNISGGVNGTTVTGTTECTVGIDTSADLTIDSLNLDDENGSIKLDGVTKVNLGAALGIQFTSDLYRSGEWEVQATGIPGSTGRFTLGGTNGVALQYNSSEKLRVDSTGVNVTVGSGTGTAIIRDASGYLLEDTSSKRWKENLRPLEVDSASVYELKPRSFENAQGRTDFNWVAEEVALIEPSLASYDADGVTPRGVRTSRVVVLLLEEVKLLKSRVDELEKRLEAARLSK